MTEWQSTGRQRLNMPFVGIPTFLRSPLLTLDEPQVMGGKVRAGVLGVPFDEGQPYMSASRLGARAMREQSLRFVSSEPGIYDPNLAEQRLAQSVSEASIVDFGDVDVLPTNVVGTFENISRDVSSILSRGAMPVILGGDHSVTYPVVRAFDRELHVIHFDAHLDYQPFVHGIQLSNSHPFRHIARMEHVVSLTQVGIRSLRNTRSMHADSISDGNRVITMLDLERDGLECVAQGIPDGASIYISIDIDVLDLPLVPGCVSAEPNGMSYRDLVTILSVLTGRFDVAGFDVVEISPPLDVPTQITSYLGAHLVVDLLSRILP